MTTSPGRWAQVRPVNESEIRSIVLMRIKLDEVSAKIRTGYPGEESGAPLPDPVPNRVPLGRGHVALVRSKGAFQPGFGSALADGQPA